MTYEVLHKYKEALEQGKSARTVTFETKDEIKQEAKSKENEEMRTGRHM